MKFRTSERVMLVGATGTGKTYFAQKLLTPVPRLIVLDPKATLRGKWGLTEWSNQTRRALYRGDPVRARFSPPPGGEHEYEYIFETCYNAGNVLIYVDEVYGIVPPGRSAPPYFSAVYTRGRELGVGVVAATQRPAWVPLFVASEAQTFVMFRLLLDKDKRRMAEFMGPGVLADIPDPHGFYLYQTSWASAGNGVRYYRKVI